MKSPSDFMFSRRLRFHFGALQDATVAAELGCPDSCGGVVGWCGVGWSWQQRLFGIISRACIALYGRFPVFGALRGAAAVIRKDNRFLVLERSDGLGLAFPGGLAHFWESEERALARELREETGLRLRSQSLLLRYATSIPYPSRVAVFLAEAEGELHSSWEGTPRWVEFPELQQRLMRNQRPVLEKGGLDRSGQ
jgi:8-oxo-dGTP pyrophosphatase MutT (NUDIX family)